MFVLDLFGIMGGLAVLEVLFVLHQKRGMRSYFEVLVIPIAQPLYDLKVLESLRLHFSWKVTRRATLTL